MTKLLLLIFLSISFSGFCFERLAQNEYLTSYSEDQCGRNIPTDCVAYIERFSRLSRASSFAYNEVYKRANWIFQSDERVRLQLEYSSWDNPDLVSSGFEITARDCQNFRSIDLYRVVRTGQMARERNSSHVKLSFSQVGCAQPTLIVLDKAEREHQITQRDCVHTRENLNLYGRNLFDACYAVFGIDMIRSFDPNSDDCVECSASYQAWTSDVETFVSTISLTLNTENREMEQEQAVRNDPLYASNVRLWRDQLNQTVEEQFFTDLLRNLLRKLPQEEVYRLIVEYGNSQRSPNLRAIWIQHLIDMRYSRFYDLGVKTTMRYANRRIELDQILDRELKRTDLSNREASVLTDMLLLRLKESGGVQNFHQLENHFENLLRSGVALNKFESEGSQQELAYFIDSNFYQPLEVSENNRAAIVRLLKLADNPKHHWILRNKINENLFEFQIVQYLENPSRELYQSIIRSAQVIKHAPSNDQLEARLRELRRQNSPQSKEIKEFLKFY